MKVSCSKCSAVLDPMFLVEGLIVTGGKTVRCACGYEVDGVKARSVLECAFTLETVAEAKATLHAKLEKGAQCPCCDQFAKRYIRRMSSIICRWLIAFARASEGDRTKWVHVRECGHILGGESSAARSGDYAKARWWGLVEAGLEDEEADHGSIDATATTEKGWKFVANQLLVREQVVVYNNDPIEFQGKEVSIVAGLGTKFSYSALMGPASLETTSS